MELVYLWVDNYKNIKNQGFNFSPRFECEFKAEYDEDKKLKNDCELKITPKEHIENFFGKDINVTAIVGENGSGKSSVISSIMQIIYSINKNQKIYILVFSNNSEISYQSNKKINTTITESSDNLEKMFYSILFDFSLGNGDIYNQQKDNYKKNYSIEPSRNYYTGSMGHISKIENQSYNANMYANAIYFYKHVNKKVIEDLKLPNFYKLKYKTKTQINKRDETLRNINTVRKSNFSFEKLQSQIEKISFESFFNEYNDIQNEILILFKLEFTNDKGLDFSSLSKGQQQIISYLGILTKLKERFVEKKSINLFFDEVESALHPNWQKKFMYIIIKFIQKSDFFQKNVKINLIFATHSPFILSDLPKENVIFLNKFDEKDKEELKIKYPKLNLNGLENGNCINVTEHIELKTFGANIHTLLSDGFFMSDGLMGEFAKSKISEIKKFYELIQNLQNKGKIKNKNLWKKSYERRKTRFENIQKIIGEPFLQTIIKNYLDDLHIILSDDKTLIDKELAELEKRKKHLESLKNAKN